MSQNSGKIKLMSEKFYCPERHKNISRKVNLRGKIPILTL